MTKQSIIEESIREEITRKYQDTNGKITLYLNEHLLMLIDLFADYKSRLLVNNPNQQKIMTFPRFITHLACTNHEAIENVEGIGV